MLLQVRWNPWGRADLSYLARSREVTRGRILLESPFGWRWYLGERVSRQSLELPEFRVPGPLPPRVQRTQEYTVGELETFTVLDTELVFDPSADYPDYVRDFLAYTLDLTPPPAPVEPVPLPAVRRVLDVMIPGGAMRVIDVPAVTSPVAFEATEVT